MEIITITLGTGSDGKPFMELRFSEGVNPPEAARACRAAAVQFDELRIQAEVAARVAAQATEDETEPDNG